MVLAASTGVIGAAIVLAGVVYLMPFYFARRIGERKGLRWFRYAFFLHWLGVLILALRHPAAQAAPGIGSRYHVPPDLAARKKGGRKTHWMYDQRRG